MALSTVSIPSLLRAAAFILVTAMTAGAEGRGFADLQGGYHEPLQSRSTVTVLLFVRTDCPITNRYAPELQRLAAEFNGNPVAFWLIYADRLETVANIKKQVDSYRLPGTPLLDPHHELVVRAHATVAPEAAVFDGSGKLLYHGRIDNRWVDVGKSRPAATVHDLEDAITATLHGKPLKEAETRAVGCSLADVE